MNLPLKNLKINRINTKCIYNVWFINDLVMYKGKKDRLQDLRGRIQESEILMMNM